MVVRLFRDFQIFGFSALLPTSPLCVARKLITLYFATSTTLSINNLYPMVMTGLVNGLRIMSRMVMEENFNRDIQRGVIETKHVYFRQNAIIRPLQKCDNNAKQDNRIFTCFLKFPKTTRTSLMDMIKPFKVLKPKHGKTSKLWEGMVCFPI